jgi:diguanylate cyclase (GGDEF)-like protein
MVSRSGTGISVVGRTASSRRAALDARQVGAKPFAERAATSGPHLRFGSGEEADAPGTPTRSEAARLVAEVERLRTELAAARARMTELEAKADVDPLLDIFNRRGFARELDRALAYVRRYGNPAALIYLDLDRFKPINDTYGHAAGDEVLRAVARILAANVRASDTVARLGGDEFAVLLWNLDEGAAAAKAVALETRIAAAAVTVGGQPLAVAASAGVATLRPDDDAAAVLARADAAMYARKTARRRA